MDSVKSCLFIRTDDDHVYVPRPTSVFAGMARQRWLKSYFGQKTIIASPTLWSSLSYNYTVSILRQEDDDYKEEELVKC
jgi:hypothetical protein